MYAAIPGHLPEQVETARKHFTIPGCQLSVIATDIFATCSGDSLSFRDDLLPFPKKQRREIIYRLHPTQNVMVTNSSKNNCVASSLKNYCYIHI